MQAKVFLPASIALAVLVAGCAPAPPPVAPDTRDADAKAIRQLEADWAQAFATKDVEKATAFYTEDASLLNAGVPIVAGKANIVNTWKQYLADPNFSLTFSTDKVVVAKSSDIASTQGSYSLTYTDPKTKKQVSEKGKYVEVYMKQADGSWKDVTDISNADGPATPVSKK
jgi:uncharacterized protein (TIGR02246 family)